MDPVFAQLVGTRIKLARTRAGLSPAQVAESVHTSRPAVTHWETGRNCPTLDTIPPLASLLGVSVEYLLGGLDNPIPPVGTLPAVQRAAKQAVAAVLGVAPEQVEVEFRVRG